MIHKVFAVRDTCVGSFMLPMFFQNSAAAVRALGDAVNAPPSKDNLFGTHPEHFQLWYVGSFEDETGVLIPHPNAPEFVVDCQSLVRTS